MSYIVDMMAEKQIRKALENGELDNLPGRGQPLQLDDNSMVPESLRACYRILKNSGFLPPELEDHHEALKLHDLIKAVTTESDPKQQNIREKQQKLAQLELKLRLKGFDTVFIQNAMNKC